MPAILAHATQLRALRETLLRLDPPMAQAVDATTAATVEADAVLREVGIQLVTLETLQAANQMDTSFTRRLRARVDALIAPLTHPMPVNQLDED